MLMDGLYSVQFKTSLGAGAGVVLLAGNRIRGGDSTMAYVGQVTLNGADFSADVTTKRHAPGPASVFGNDSVSITLSGKPSASGDSAVCKGTSPDAPGVTFQATLTRISE